MPEYQTKLDRL